MKGKRLKLWQAILLAFGTISVATGGVVLYTYLTTGFESQKIEPENISFVTDENFNVVTNQFEIDSSFNITIKATNEGVTEKEVILSFEKSLSTDSTIAYSESTRDGVRYISNGIITVPQNVNIGEPFQVTVNQDRFSVDNGDGTTYTYYANVGGISTLLAKTKSDVEVREARTNIAVDVPVDSVRFEIENAELKESAYKILQSSTFDIDVNYYPASSQYRYSDNLFSEFYGLAKEIREKDFCFDSADINVVKHYNDGNVYFTSNNVISKDNLIDFYLFKTAKAEEKFEATIRNQDIEGEVYYNAMIAYFVTAPKNEIVSVPLSFSIEQAEVGSVTVTNRTFNGTTNKLFTLSVNSNTFGDGTLGLGIANKEGENLASSMISQIALQISYTKAGETKKSFPASEDDDTIVVMGADGEVVLGNDKVTSPYLFDGKTYFLVNASMKELKNAYWEISTKEDSIEIEMQVVLFVLDNEQLVIFDDGNSANRIVSLSIEKHEDAGIDWQGETTKNETIIHSGSEKIAGHIDATSIINIPRDNIYQTTRYYVAKTTDWSENKVDDVNVNADENKSREFDGVKYYLATSGDLFFKTAGTYYVRFVTVRTDAYGRVILDGEEKEIIEKTSRILTVNVSETLQAFEEENILIDKEKTNGVFRKTDDLVFDEDKTYYLNDNGEYVAADYINRDNFGANRDLLYELSYYALKTGSTDLKLVIRVGEEDIDMLRTEILENHRISISAISSDGSISIPLEIVSVIGDGKDATISLKISDETIIQDTDGKGCAFYIVIDYFNTVSHILTPVEVKDHPATANAKQCFMIYTQTPQKIENKYLNNKELNASIELSSTGAYDTCNITYKGNGGIDVSLAGEYNEGKADEEQVANDKEALNKRILETTIYDGYDRKIEKQPYVSIVENNASSVFVKNNLEVDFANGEEKVNIKVSADNSESKNFTFAVSTKSYGLAKVQVGENEFEGQRLSNITYDVDGEKDSTINISSDITIFVGKENEGAYNTLNNKYIYVKNENPANIKNMLSFYNGDTKLTEVTALTPITKIKIERDFFATGSLKLLVSNKDYSNQNDTSQETVSFEVTVNFGSYITPTLKLNENQAYATQTGNEFVNPLTDGIYAGYYYNLDKLISLKNNKGTEIKWSGSTYVSGTGNYNIGRNGDVSTTATDIIGSINKSSQIYFNDVTEITTYTIRLYYTIDETTPNTYCYYGDVTIKVYPNLKLDEPQKDISLVKLASLNQAQEAIGNYFEAKRIREGVSVSNIEYKITDHDSYVVKISGTNFVFDQANALSLPYGSLSDSMTVGLYLKNSNGDSVAVKNANGENVTTTLNVNVGTDIASIAKAIKEYGTVDSYLQTTKYNGNDVLFVDAESGKYVISDPNQSTGIEIPGTTNRYYFRVLTYRTAYNLGANSVCNFVAPASGIIYNESMYLWMQVQVKINGDPVTVAQIKVPLLISGVGLDLVKYSDYTVTDINTLLNGGGDFKITSDTEPQEEKVYYTLSSEGYKAFSGNSFVVGTTYYEFVDNENFPYETMTAGQDYQISYNKSDMGSNVGLYRDETKLQITSVAFVDEDSELGNVYRDGNGDWHIQFANLANSERFASLVVYYARSSSTLRFTYRIKLLPNVFTETIYPFAENANGAAEFIKVNSSAEYDLADVFGSYAGSKADKTRFNYYLDKKSAKVDESEEYYVSVEPTSAQGNVFIPNGTALYTYDGASYNEALTLKNPLRIEGYAEINEDGYYKLTIFNTTYSIFNISVKENAGSGDYISLEDLSDGEHSKIISSETTYNFTISTDVNGTRTFVLKLNNVTDIATIVITKDGLMTLSNVNSAYAITLEILKEYSSVVGGNLKYKFVVNEGSGIYYVVYKDGNNNTINNNVTQEVETIYQNQFTLTVRFASTDGSSQNVGQEDNITLTKTEKLLDMHGNEVSTSDLGINVTLNKVASSASDWTLTISKNAFVSQDYTLIIYIASSTEVISTLTLNIPCSVKETIDSAEFNAGTTIDVSDFGFKDSNGQNVNVTSYEILPDETYDSIISSTGEIVALKEDVNGLVLKFKFTCAAGIFFRDINANIKRNVTTASSYILGDQYYAGKIGEIATQNFYSISDGTTIDITKLSIELINEPENITDVALSADKTELTFSSKDVATTVENEVVRVKFIYTYGEGENDFFTWETTLRITILPNTSWQVTYPDPETGSEGTKSANALTGESVVAGKEYKDLFSGVAPFASENRIKAFDETDEDKPERALTTQNTKITVKSIANVSIEGVENALEEIFNIASDFKFILADNASQGTVVFEIELNAVKTTYTVYVFEEKYVEAETITLVQTADNETNIIFLEALKEGNIFAENTIAKVNMRDLASGTYYIKLEGTTNPWVGFNYDADGSNVVYVHLGQQVKGDVAVVGLYSSKVSTATNISDIEIELTSFVKLKYKTMSGNTTKLVDLADFVDYTAYAKNNQETDKTPLIIIGEDYYAITASGLNKVTIEEDNLTYYVDGTYNVYDINISGNTYASQTTITTQSTDNLGQALTKTGDNYSFDGYTFSGTKVNGYYEVNGGDYYFTGDINEYYATDPEATSYSVTISQTTINADDVSEDSLTPGKGYYILSGKSETGETDPNTKYYVAESALKYYVLAVEQTGTITVENGKYYLGATQIYDVAKNIITDSKFSKVIYSLTNEGAQDQTIYILASVDDITNGTAYYQNTTGETIGIIYEANVVGKTVTSEGKSYYVTRVESDQYKLSDQGSFSATKMTISEIANSGSMPAHVQKVTEIGTDVARLIEAFGYNSDQFVERNNVKYLVQTLGDQKYFLTLPIQAYISTTHSASINGKVVGDFEDQDGNGIVKLDNGKYVQIAKSEINSRTYNDTNYVLANMNTYSINSISSLKTGENVMVTFNYVVDGIVGEFSVGFVLDIDMDLENAYSGEEIENLTSIEDLNYIELEVNNTYDFNNIVGVVRKSTGDVITASDVIDSSTVRLEVVSSGTEYNKLKNDAILGNELKSNSDVIRFAFELVKADSSDDAAVYNFNVRARGADNNGDYVLVRYTYTMNVLNSSLENESSNYDFERYVIFKLVPDYVVTLKDTDGNILIPDNDSAVVSNSNSVAYISDFDTIGAIVENKEKNTLKDLSGKNVSTFTLAENQTFSYTYGYGKKSENTQNDNYTAITYSGDGLIYFVQTNAISATDTISGDAKCYVNINIPVTTGDSANEGLVKVTSKNAVNSLQDLSAAVFDATLSSANGNSGDIDTYLDLGYIGNNTLVQKRNGGMKIRIGSDVCLGQRDFVVKIVDEYGYTIKYYFSLVASSNPTYAKGPTSFVEGNTFDIGAQFEKVEIATWETKNELVYVKDTNATSGTKFSVIYSSTYEKAYTFNKSTTYYIPSGTGYTKVDAPKEENFRNYYIKKADGTDYTKAYTYNSENTYYTYADGTYTEVGTNNEKDFKSYYVLNVIVDRDYRYESVIEKYAPYYTKNGDNYESVTTPSTSEFNSYYVISPVEISNKNICLLSSGVYYVFSNKSAISASLDSLYEANQLKQTDEIIAGNDYYILNQAGVVKYYNRIENPNSYTKTDLYTISKINALYYKNGENYQKVESSTDLTDKEVYIIESELAQELYDASAEYYTKSGTIYSKVESPNANDFATYYLPRSGVYYQSADNGTYFYKVNIESFKPGQTYYVIDNENGTTAYCVDFANYEVDGAKATISANSQSGNYYIDGEYSNETYFKVKYGSGENEYFLAIKEELHANSVTTTITDPTNNVTADGFKGVVTLAGINAFGYDTQEISANGKSGKYFVTGSDLDKIRITDVYYTFNGINVGKSLENSEKEFASSGSVYYKYNSTDHIGRDVLENYTIPVLPGWVYGDQDSATVIMNIVMKYSNDEKEETYTLPIPVTITKQSERIITLSATNVSDDTDITLSSHLKEGNNGTAFSYYDDTIAVTLPGSGKVTVNVVAYKTAYNSATTYYTYENNQFEEVSTSDPDEKEKGFYEGKYYVIENGSYIKACYVGTETLQSNTRVDFTYYVGLSRTVGRTLDPSYTVEVTFSNYDNSKITREGHFGFYASYSNNRISTSGQSGNLAVGGNVQYVYGYGQRTSVTDNVGQFTAIYYEGNKIGYIPTENIDKIAGTLIRCTSYVTELASENVKPIEFNISWDTKFETDKLHITDMYNLTNGRQAVTKYYIGHYGDESEAYYQLVKSYYIYPTYFGLRTSDYNDSVQATETSRNGSISTFDLSKWAGQVNLSNYGAAGSINSDATNTIYSNSILPFYFELGDKNTTSATINRKTGLITIDNSKYELNGQEYITINIYVKASGETGEYIDDNLDFSGNLYNSPAITISVYLNADPALS